VLNAAFSEDVLQQGNNSDVLELGPTDAVVLRVQTHENETTKPFDSVKDQVAEAAAKALASDKARAEGEKLLSSLRDGGSLKQVADSHAWQLVQKTVSRRADEAPAEIVDAAFGVPSLGHKGPSYVGVVSAEGDYMLIGVDKITDGDVASLTEPERQSSRAELSRTLGSLQFKGVLEALRARSDIEILLK